MCCDGRGCYRCNPNKRRALSNMAPEMLKALKEYHKAIDLLLAQLVVAVPGFLPSKSGQPWKALTKGNAVIKKAGG